MRKSVLCEVIHGIIPGFLPLVLELILVTEHNKFIFLSADFMPAQPTLPPPPTFPSSQNKRDVSSPSKKSVYNEVEKL